MEIDSEFESRWETQYTKEIVCPYCKYEFPDSWEFNNINGETEVGCHNCDKDFILNVDFDITYCTHKKEKQNETFRTEGEG